MSLPPAKISSPDHPSMDVLRAKLQDASARLETVSDWPAEQLRLCGEYGVYEWFMLKEWHGQQWSDEQVVRGYLALSAACLTTTFVITQRAGACQRIERSSNEELKHKLLPRLVTGESFATVGISHLTTSRQHVTRPVLRAYQEGNDFILDGYSPWVTGARAAETVVVGATLEDQRQILVAAPMDLPDIHVPAPLTLIGMAASQTGPIEFDNVRISSERLLAGPVHDVMKQGVGARTGGLQTSTLAVGLAQCPIDFLDQESQRRPDLTDYVRALRNDWERLRSDLLRSAANEPTCSDADLRTRANSLVLRASQAALAAAKGTGYVVGHPAGRWCREALFFLVWSCPQPVMAANLCEFSGLD